MTASDAERLYSAVRLLLDSGDITPQGAKVISGIVGEASY